MFSRRRFLAATSLTLAGAAITGDTMLRQLLATVERASPGFPAFTRAGGPTLNTNVAAALAANTFTITTSGTNRAQGYRPATTYNALWTRDNAYVIYHNPGLLTAAQRRQFVTYYLSRRTTGVEADPDGGTLPANFIADHISATGTATFKNAGASKLPFMDGIAFVVLALWSDWNLTADLTTFTASQSAIDDCLAAIPRSGSGCVYSDPATPSVDYGFTDGILKTGDVAYGTALQAWAYKMMAQMNGESGSGTYTTLRATAEAGLLTLVNSGTSYLKGSSGNNAARDDVWASALAAAEGLLPSAERLAIATTLRDTYAAGANDGTGAWVSGISQYGLVRHLPVGQTWAGTAETSGTYQNGGYWATPLWDVARAVSLVDHAVACRWLDDFIAQVNAEYTASSSNWALVPWEWHNHSVGLGAQGYAPSAAIVKRFA